MQSELGISYDPGRDDQRIKALTEIIMRELSLKEKASDGYSKKKGVAASQKRQLSDQEQELLEEEQKKKSSDLER